MDRYGGLCYGAGRRGRPNREKKRVAALFLGQAAGSAFGVLPAPVHEAIDPARLARPGVSAPGQAALPRLRAGRCSRGGHRGQAEETGAEEQPFSHANLPFVRGYLNRVRPRRQKGSVAVEQVAVEQVAVEQVAVEQEVVRLDSRPQMSNCWRESTAVITALDHFEMKEAAN